MVVEYVQSVVQSVYGGTDVVPLPHLVGAVAPYLLT